MLRDVTNVGRENVDGGDAVRAYGVRVNVVGTHAVSKMLSEHLAAEKNVF